MPAPSKPPPKVEPVKKAAPPPAGTKVHKYMLDPFDLGVGSGVMCCVRVCLGVKD